MGFDYTAIEQSGSLSLESEPQIELGDNFSLETESDSNLFAISTPSDSNDSRDSSTEFLTGRINK